MVHSSDCMVLYLAVQANPCSGPWAGHHAVPPRSFLVLLPLDHALGRLFLAPFADTSLDASPRSVREGRNKNGP